MKSFRFFFTIMLVTLLGYIKGYAGITKNGPGPDANDTSINLKSNIVIFKMIPTPSGNTNGSLKQAGKVARTSGSHTSIENILYKKKGI